MKAPQSNREKRLRFSFAVEQHHGVFPVGRNNEPSGRQRKKKGKRKQINHNKNSGLSTGSAAFPERTRRANPACPSPSASPARPPDNGAFPRAIVDPTLKKKKKKKRRKDKSGNVRNGSR